MSQVRLSMRKVFEILRLKFEVKLSNREIAQACKISSSTVYKFLMRFGATGLSWPLPKEINEEDLERKLYPEDKGDFLKQEMPDWTEVHQELKKKGVTLHLLWQEYKRTYPDGYQYSWFCEKYNEYRRLMEPVMRQRYKFGEKCFVDYAGYTVPIINANTGEERKSYIFVGVLGASNYTYAEATFSQDSVSWLSAHIRMFNFFGGVPRILVPDNLKSGVKKPDYYEPDINPVYQELAKHYNVAVIPARVYKPRHKAKVETGVQVVEREILAVISSR